MGFLRRLFKTSTVHPQIRVYHSYGDEDRCFVLGHVLEEAPERPSSKKKESFWRNAKAMLRLFSLQPQAGAQVKLQLGVRTILAITNEDGFFHVDIPGDALKQSGWHLVEVHGLSGAASGCVGEGKVYHPASKKQGFISDIDDTFLISHARNIFLRLRTLLTKSPQTRRPFEGVVAHYQALALKGATAETPNPFFYVSSSEWNLYDYIKEFCRFHQLPEGIFLLSNLKQLSDFARTGSNNHGTKYDRIARILEEYPATRFTLLGDDTQQDPVIYRRVVAQFGQQINAVYMRHRAKQNKSRTEVLLDEIRAAGISVCYFRHSKEALAHSREIGLA